MRLIDADALLKQMCKECFGGDGLKPCGGKVCYEYSLIEKQPTIDAVAVTRCGECSYHHDGYGEEKGDFCYRYPYMVHRVRKDSGCSYGVKMKDDLTCVIKGTDACPCNDRVDSDCNECKERVEE